MSRHNRTRRATATPAVKATAGVALCMAGLAGCSRAEQQPTTPPATTGGAIDRTAIPLTQPGIFSADETADVGIDLGTPVVEAIGAEARSRFKGHIPRVTVAVK
jgi:hypothetical protein